MYSQIKYKFSRFSIDHLTIINEQEAMICYNKCLIISQNDFEYFGPDGCARYTRKYNRFLKCQLIELYLYFILTINFDNVFCPNYVITRKRQIAKKKRSEICNRKKYDKQMCKHRLTIDVTYMEKKMNGNKI